MLRTIAISIVVFCVVILAGNILLDEYAREADFLNYRLALHIHDGHGMVYNDGEDALLTISPLSAMLPALAPRAGIELMAAIFALSVAVASFSIMRLSQNPLVIVIWLAMAPLWWAFRSPAIVAFVLVIMALDLMAQRHYRLAGLLAGLGTLAHPGGIVGALLIGLYDRQRRYWLIVLLPGILWAGYALLAYETAHIIIPSGYGETWQGLLWIGLLAAAVGVLAYLGVDRWIWVCAAWATIETTGYFLIQGDIQMVSSIPLTLTIALAVVSGVQSLPSSQRIAATGGAILLTGVLLIIMPPRTPDALQHDLDSDLSLDDQASLAHNRTDALTYKFAGPVYRLDGERSPQIADFVEREDYSSLLVAFAPDYLYMDTSLIDLSHPNHQGLRYEATDENLWRRQSTAGVLNPVQNISLDYGLDMQLTGYATDRNPIMPGQTVRVRLDWELNLKPDDEVGVYLNLIPPNSSPIVSIFPGFPAANWQADRVSTYHVLAVPEDALQGIVNLNVVVNYQAGVPGNHNPGQLVVLAPPDPALYAETPVGESDLLQLMGYELQIEADQLRVELIWEPLAAFEAEHRTFIHFIPVGDVQPVTQADGPPLSGRYPATAWLPGHAFQDTFFIPLYDYSSGEQQPLAPGEYEVRVGLYNPENGQRVQWTAGDSLLLNTVQVQEDGSIQILSASRNLD